MRQTARPLPDLIKKLFGLHICFILITPLLLTFNRFSIGGPLAYAAILFWVGFRRTEKFLKPLRTTLLAGYFSQLPGIIITLIIMAGNRLPFANDAFDFLIQIWQTPLSPIYPLLPRTSLLGIPLYFCLTLTASFLLPLIPAGGAYLSQKLKKSDQATV
ncbi:putative membrane protein [Thermacetogenium phaeum DSM 12270]|uniref:Putative membrane protein n=1 Tax=Thermacetogenium phaeum (strain ATCC BAA-254 / DSM 26808 / PB) TaxID=1089553 RepID=K4LU35_THEPS|nr:hypothetical protein [Thermacetogenium phaeum]AFV11544.1 putative membrane protein [Thermacetogenium phaeum DSM 12270]